jgi:hypothetical protein
MARRQDAAVYRVEAILLWSTSFSPIQLFPDGTIIPVGKIVSSDIF